MKVFRYLEKLNSFVTPLALGLALFFPCSMQAQSNPPNSRPTLDPITDYTTSYSADLRFIEISGITPGEEDDQQVSIEVSTEDKDLLESIGADLVDNGKAVINYQLKKDVAGTATVKVVVTDNGPTPSSVTRTFHITIESLNRELTPKPSAEETSLHLKASPNPALVSTRIFFSTPYDEQLTAVDLYTLSGVKIKQLFAGSTIANQSRYVDLNTKTLASGVYVVRLTGQSYSSNLKLAVAK